METTVDLDTATAPFGAQSPGPADNGADGGIAPPNGSEPPPEADGGEESETPQNWPTNWREVMAGGDQKKLGQLARYASPLNVYNSLRSLQGRLSAGDFIRAKPDGKSEAAMKEWRATAGIPEKPEGYLQNLPDGLIIGKEDEEIAKTFLADMHAKDAPPAFVHNALQWYYSHQEKLAEAQYARDTETRQKTEDALHAEWGPEFRANLNSVHALVDLYGSDTLKANLYGARLPNGEALGDNAEILQFLVSLAREINPRGIVTPGSGQPLGGAVQSEKAKIEASMAIPRRQSGPGDYWNNPEMQKRYSELLALEERQKFRKG